MSKYVKLVAVILIFVALAVAVLIFVSQPYAQIDDPTTAEKPTVYDRPATTEPDRIVIENALP